MANKKHFMEAMGIEPIDLTEITRPGMETVIRLGPDRQVWIKCGQIDIGEDVRGKRRVGARMGLDAVDIEGDSAWAFRINVIGLEFDYCFGQALVFKGFLAPYDAYWRDGEVMLPRKPEDRLAGAETIGDYPGPVIDCLPKSRMELTRKVGGQRIEIHIYPPEHVS